MANSPSSGANWTAGRIYFFGLGGDQARERYRERLREIPNHDLSSWEEFHLLPHSTGTIGVDDKLNGHLHLLEFPYFGNAAAKERYKAVFDVLGDTPLSDIELLLSKGIDVFRLLAARELAARRGALSGLPHTEVLVEATIALLRQLFPTLPPHMTHNLETWEWFHLDEGGEGTTQAKAKLALAAASTSAAFKPWLCIFETWFFGGVQAREKWGHLLWETKMLD